MVLKIILGVQKLFLRRKLDHEVNILETLIEIYC